MLQVAPLVKGGSGRQRVIEFERALHDDYRWQGEQEVKKILEKFEDVRELGFNLVEAAED